MRRGCLSFQNQRLVWPLTGFTYENMKKMSVLFMFKPKSYSKTIAKQCHAGLPSCMITFCEGALLKAFKLLVPISIIMSNLFCFSRMEHLTQLTQLL